MLISSSNLCETEKNVQVMVNIVSKGEHVPDIERYIRVVKERCRCDFAMLPFKTLPRLAIVHLLRTVILYINAFVWQRGISPVLSPFNILEGIRLDYDKHFHVIFGEHLNTFDDSDNTMRERTVCAMVLGPSENMQGGIRCFSLATGQILRRSLNDIILTKWTEESLGRMCYINKKQMSVKGLLFGDRQGDIEFTTFSNSDPAEDILTERDAIEHDVYNPHDSNDTESVDEIDAVDDDDTYVENSEIDYECCTCVLHWQ